MMHIPVLLHEVIAVLDPKPGDFMIDGTVDGGGHARAIIERIMPGGMFLGIDLDAKLIAQTKKAIIEKRKTEKLFFVCGNYADLPEIVRKEKLPKANGLLLDLGFSSEQLAASNRGFSFGEAARNEPLLMTYSDDREPVRDIIRRLSEKELADVIYEYGGERRSRQIAKAIKERGRRRRIETAGDLADIVREALPGNYEHGRINPATRTFQALRIYANDELGNVERVLGGLVDIVAPGGRVAVITFHSLEDRIVKVAFQNLIKTHQAEAIYKKPVTAAREEIQENPRSRSAKLRAIIMK